jgi:hypothetical protein
MKTNRWPIVELVLHVQQEREMTSGSATTTILTFSTTFPLLKDEPSIILSIWQFNIHQYLPTPTLALQPEPEIDHTPLNVYRI